MAKFPGRKAGGARSAGRKRVGTRKGPVRKKPARGAKGTGRDVDPRGTIAVLMAVVAVLVGAALFPLHLLGARADVFPAGNPVGATGDALKGLLVTWLGLGCSAVPLGIFAGAAQVGGWWAPAARKALWIVTAALLLILPVTGFLAGGQDVHFGHLGRAIGDPLLRTLGWLGAWVLVAAATVATSIAAFRFNPLRAPAAMGATAGRAAASWLRRTGSSMRTWWKRRPGPAEAGPGGAIAAPEPKPGTDAAHAGGDGLPEDGMPDPTEPADTGSPTAAVAGGPAAAPEAPDPVHPGFQSANDDLLPDDLPTGYHPSPGLDLLIAPQLANRYGMERELDRLSGVLVRTLRTFNIECEIAGRTTGPAVTQYEVVPAAGVKVNRIANLEADLALAMRARSVRIVAPIPGKGAVGVEIPNPRPEIVRLREILDAPAFARSRGALPLAMGKDLTGRPYVADLAGMPHALIAGATGSGKSVCLNTIITSLVYRHAPDRLRLLLIDPKMVELSAYADLPHLRHPVVTDPREAAGVLKWAVMEMERRYTLLGANGVRSILEFNARLEGGKELRAPAPDGPEEDPGSWKYTGGVLPWIVVVVDELADLMMTVQAEVEKPLAQLAQKARAIGIHLLVATQRPSVNVITGLIKANFPCRIAFRVASKTDSRTILDQNGADSLLGQGDMLFLPPGHSEPVRMQGAFISTEETEALMEWYRDQADTLEALKARVKAREGDILEEVKAVEGDGEGDGGVFVADWDDLFREAAEACMANKGGSTSLLQRKLRIGYGRAARIVDQLEQAGVLGPPDGSRPRDVLVGSFDELDEICPG